jgi:hypothetical protein
MKPSIVVIQHAGESDYSLITRSSDGQMLFLANKIAKMKEDSKLGSRIAEVHNGSSLFTGDAGEGESIEVPEDNTRALLFAYRPLTRKDKEDRVWATYLHSCLRYVNRNFMTNMSLRERFGIQTENISMASRFLKEAMDAGVAPAGETGWILGHSKAYHSGYAMLYHGPFLAHPYQAIAAALGRDALASLLSSVA